MCFYPIKLRNGEVVPCGHCEECYSARRNDWSVRLQLHTLSYDSMPLFITLTYDNEHLPAEGLRKKDVQDFIKRIRDKYDLYNSGFSFFGCGEYGDLMGRHHYHLLFYGMPEYNTYYWSDDEYCRKVIESDWKLGECFVCIADWSGIHYCTKYVMKFLDKDWTTDQTKPFILCSKGIGLGFMDTPQYAYIKKCCSVEKYREVLKTCPSLDRSTLQTTLSTSNEIISILKPFVESVKVTLPSGKSVPLPRYFRKKLYGSYDDWKSNPFAYFRYVQKMNRYAKDMINGAKSESRILVEKQIIKKRMLTRGHIVKPVIHFNVK